MRTKLIGIVLLAGLGLSSTAAMAQSAVEGRVDRLEKEMRAVQRKVFPGGNGQYFPPDITPQQPNPASPGSPSSTPVVDLNDRVNALEAQLASLTGKVEQTQFRLQQLSDSFAAFQRSMDVRVKALEDRATALNPSTGGDGGAAAAPVVTRPSVTPVKATAASASTPVPAPAAADPARAKLLATVEKPVTDDPADDGYVYGYRLWQAKMYPEAEAALKQVVAKYPTHRRASWAQNLLGRAYLDEGKPSLASLAFYDNYKKFHDGERAPDSLWYLTIALKKLNKPSADICQVYDELTEVYDTKLTAQMKADIAKGRTTEKCKTN